MPTEFTRKPWQRRALHLEYLLSELLYPIARRTLPYRPKMWWIPRLPMWLHPTRRPHTVPWTANIPPPPDVLRTVPGIGLIPDLQEQAFQREPLHDFTRLHPGMRSISSPTGRMWMSMLSTAPRMQSAARRRARFNTEVMPAEARTVHNAEELTGAMRREADRLGFAAVGVTHYDVRYHFAEYHGLNVGDTIVVGIVEQNYSSTQLCPSERAEKAALTAYAALEDRMRKLAEWIKAQGFDARPEGFVGESMVIPYAVQAGLGQLGLNGQLLTPNAGSRCRLHVMSTNAPFVFGKPMDFGIEGVCNSCQICVRRCPAGAIPAVRKESRGVMKAKLNTKRCLPIVGKAAGCSVCMKVCPVQRYGLTAVLNEFEMSGRVLGKDTDDLEGFDWPLDGKHYSPGERPRLEPEDFATPGFDFDPSREVPPDNIQHVAGDKRLGALGY
jgi:epoxyqueuosine reductase